MLVQQILTSKGDDGVITITEETPISDAAEILAEKRIGGLVVTDGASSVRGILSERDIVRSIAVRGAVCLGDKARSIMTRNPVFCGLDDSSDTVLTRMTEGRFRHMPVVEGGALVGIVTIGDVVKARLQELSMENSALESMIMGH